MDMGCHTCVFLYAPGGAAFPMCSAQYSICVVSSIILTTCLLQCRLLFRFGFFDSRNRFMICVVCVCYIFPRINIRVVESK